MNIEARKQARKEAEELAASIAKASAEAQKAKEKEAEAEMYAEDQAFVDKLFGSDEEYTGPIMVKYQDSIQRTFNGRCTANSKTLRH